MPLESATYISDLDPANPVSGDGLGKADDHLRLIKDVLQNTFPNLDAAVTVTPTQLNDVPAIRTELNSLSAGAVPIGCILMFYSSTPPSGFMLCDGSTHARSDGAGNITAPDLRDRFVIGAGSTYTHGDTGGAATDAITTSSNGAHTHTAAAGGDHDHGAATGAHALTEAEMPAHSHTNTVSPANGQVLNAGAGSGANGWAGGTDPVTTITVTDSTKGSGSAHSHTISASGTHTHSTDSQGAHTHTATVDTLPPYYCLTYIMKY